MHIVVTFVCGGREFVVARNHSTGKNQVARVGCGSWLRSWAARQPPLWPTPVDDFHPRPSRQPAAQGCAASCARPLCNFP
jgi:hypothetical protein